MNDISGGAPNPARFCHVADALLRGYAEYLARCEADAVTARIDGLFQKARRSRPSAPSTASVELSRRNRDLYASRIDRLRALCDDYIRAAAAITIAPFSNESLYEHTFKSIAPYTEEAQIEERKTPHEFKSPVQSRSSRVTRVQVENHRRRRLSAGFALAGDSSPRFLSCTLDYRDINNPNNCIDAKNNYSVNDYNNNGTNYTRGSSLLERTNAQLKRSASALQLHLERSRGFTNGATTTAPTESASAWELCDRVDSNSQSTTTLSYLSSVTPIATNLATMKALETQLAGMLGRFHIEVKAIIGFARLTAGDSFEVSIKHGNQRWKTRGKTLLDRTQAWEQTTGMLNCIHDAPINIKVMELHFFKSKCLNDRSFDAARFFVAQPQLVTMNLNSIGSLKLQLVVTWLPLLSSKCVPLTNPGMLAQQQSTMNGMSRSMASIPTVPNAALFQHAKQISSASQVSAAFGSRSKSIDSPVKSRYPSDVHDKDASDDDCHVDAISADESSPSFPRSNCASSVASTEAQKASKNITDSPPKICLREKKRQRRNGEVRPPSSAYSSAVSIGMPLDKNRWRHSSTMILDTLYRDLSKSIPSIDDLSTKRMQKLSYSEDSDRPVARSDASATTLPRPATSKVSTSPARPVENGVTDTNEFSPSKISEDGASSMGGSVNGSTKKNRLSSLKKNRMNSTSKFNSSYYAKVPTLDTLNATTSMTNTHKPSLPPSRPFSTICVEEAPPHAVDALMQMRRRSPAAAPKSSLVAIAETGRESASSESALKTANALLLQIETLRRLLLHFNSVDDDTTDTDGFPELVNFEACMLNWEAILKLSRAFIVDDLRVHRLGSLPPHPPSSAYGYGARSMYVSQSPHPHISHSPSTASDDADDATAATQPPTAAGVSSSGTLMDQVSENDSGIDSLRQHISPYHSANGSYHQPSHKSQESASNGSFAQRSNIESQPNRFKQFKERRKSLGALLDAIHPLRRGSADSPPSAFHLGAVRNNLNPIQSHHALTSSVSSASSESESRRGSSAFHATQGISATGHAEVDDCLAHHFTLAIASLERIISVRATPFEYTLSEMLTRIEQDTIAFETLRRVASQLPAPPNLGMLFHELGVNGELRDIWMGASALSRTVLIVPSEALRHQIRLFVQPIVTARRYSNLLNNVVNSIMRFMCERSNSSSGESTKVTLFQFIAFFSGKDLSVFVENISHEAWITVNLDSYSPKQVQEVMDRLRKVPVVPPLESLRHIALVLATAAESTNGDALIAPIERYLTGASANLVGDLAASFMCILEHDDDASRLGACRALAITAQENSLAHLQYLAAKDADARVRTAARQAATEVLRKCRINPPAYNNYHANRPITAGDYIEVTKI